MFLGVTFCNNSFAARWCMVSLLSSSCLSEWVFWFLYKKKGPKILTPSLPRSYSLGCSFFFGVFKGHYLARKSAKFELVMWKNCESCKVCYHWNACSIRQEIGHHLQAFHATVHAPIEIHWMHEKLIEVQCLKNISIFAVHLMTIDM